MYANGEGVIKDYEKAVEWFKKAAQQGYALAQFNLGVMYAKGDGVTQDMKKALQWIAKLPTKGLPKLKMLSKN